MNARDQHPASVGAGGVLSSLDPSAAGTIKDIFGGVHTAGKVVLTAYGLGPLAAPLEGLENSAGILPAWAGGSPAAPAGPSAPVAFVVSPDFVVLLRSSNPKGDVLSNVRAAGIVGGARFDGNGYRKGDGVGRTFSFGWDGPQRVDLALQGGQKISVGDVQRVLFLGGSESATSVVGGASSRSGTMSDHMQDICGAVLRDLGGTEAAPSATSYEVAPGEYEAHGKSVRDRGGTERAAPSSSYEVAPGEYFIGEVMKELGEEPPFKMAENEYIMGCDILGAVQPPPRPKGRAPVGPTSPSTRSRLSPADAARKHPLHAAKAAKKAAVAASTAARKALAPAKTFPVISKGTSVRGDVEVLGVVSPGTSAVVTLSKPLTSKQKKAVDKYNKAVEKYKGVAAVAKKKGLDAQQKAKAIRSVVSNASGSVKAMLAKKTKMKGLSRDPLEEMVGELVGDDYPADPSDFPTDVPLDVPITAPPPLDVSIHTVPPDGIVYDGSKGFPRYGFGSKAFMDSGGENGVVYGYDGMVARGIVDPAGGGGVSVGPDPTRFILRLGRGAGGVPNYREMGDAAGDAKLAAKVSQGSGLGPLIGNPKGDFANLRLATDTGQWFWYLEEAPDFATVEMRYNAAKVQAAADAAAAAAAAADQAAADKAQAERDAAQAQQDAQNALAESAAQSELTVAQTKADAADTLAQQDYAAKAAAQDLEQQHLDTTAATADTDLERQAAAADLQAAQAQQALEQRAAAADLDWAIAHPEAAAAAQAPQDGDGGDGGDAIPEVDDSGAPSSEDEG